MTKLEAELEPMTQLGEIYSISHSNPTAQDVFDFDKIATVFFAVIHIHHAKSMWVQLVDPNILLRITELAAPYMLHPEMYVARHGPGRLKWVPGSSDDALLVFDPTFRRFNWWWHDGKSAEAVLDLNATNVPRIFAGSLAMWCFEGNEVQHGSSVMKMDSDGKPLFIAICLDVRSSYTVKMDLMVHVDMTMDLCTGGG